jgi:NitT/TauT family transport system permease protein
LVAGPLIRMLSRGPALKPALVLLGVLVAWEAGVALLRLPFYALPPPSQIAVALVDGFSTDPSARAGFLSHIITTLSEALIGLVIGCTLGIALGAVLAESRLAGRYGFPYVVALQAAPKIALAPILIIWLGLGLASKIVLVVLITFFPLVISTMAGIKSVDSERIELMTSLSASRWQTFRLVKFPSALPFIFAGLYQAILNSIVGAVASEFVAAQRGLGVLIQELTLKMNISGVYAVLIILAVIGIGLSQAISATRARVLFWAPKARGEQ